MLLIEINYVDFHILTITYTIFSTLQRSSHSKLYPQTSCEYNNDKIYDENEEEKLLCTPFSFIITFNEIIGAAVVFTLHRYRPNVLTLI